MRITKSCKYVVLYWAAAGLLAFWIAGCNLNPFDVQNTQYSADASFSFVVNVENQTRLSLAAKNGPVQITGVANATTAEITGRRVVNSESLRDAQRSLANLKVTVSTDGESVRVETLQPAGSNGREYLVEYTIRVPDSWDVIADHQNGGVQIDSLRGATHISLANGQIVLSETAGNVDIGLTNGQIFSKIRLPEQGECRMSVTNGQIDLQLPHTTAADFSAAVSNGTVSVSNLSLQNRVSSLKSVTGTLGSGGGTIHLRAINGTIRVSGY